MPVTSRRSIGRRAFSGAVFAGGVLAWGGCTSPRATLGPRDADGVFRIGGDDDFSATVRGRVAVIDFWATWCEPCRESIPKVIAYAYRVEPQQVVVVGVHVGDGHEDAHRFAAEAGITYPIFADPDYRLSAKYGASRVPTVVVLDDAGEVAATAQHIDAEVEAAVTAALARRGASRAQSSPSTRR
jgi:thiol-disulfide isomerase/thioredoxin